MATLADLKARIIIETDRDDLGSGGEAEGALANAIARAIEHYADERFWFGRDSASVSTVPGTNYVVRPYAVRVVETVSYQNEPLEKVDIASIEYAGDSGRPTHWAENGDLIQLWPIPDGSYSLSVHGGAQIDAPENDSDETVWTNEAYDLIAARVRLLLYRDVFRDTEGAQLAKGAEDEELSRLRGESRRRGRTMLRPAGGAPWAGAQSFNINRGW